MAKTIKPELNRYLGSLDKAALEAEVKKLFAKIPAVKQYYELELGKDTSAVLEQFKYKIRKEYFPSRGFGHARSSVSKKIITDFKKIAPFPGDVAELLLYRTDMMLEYTLAYGDMSESFYTSLCNSFHDACILIQNENLEKEFKAYSAGLVEKAYPMGWGVYDSLLYSYSNYVDEH